MISKNTFPFSIYGPNNTHYVTVDFPMCSIELIDKSPYFKWTEVGQLYLRYVHYKAKEHQDYGEERYDNQYKSTSYFTQQIKANARRRKHESNTRRSKQTTT